MARASGLSSSAASLSAATISIQQSGASGWCQWLVQSGASGWCSVLPTSGVGNVGQGQVGLDVDT
jgi:hypothetical protein